MVKLHINVDHVATLREARKISEPDPIAAAMACEQAGADGITVHLREDRRHIQDHDVKRLREKIRTRLNLEMALVPAILEFAIATKPDEVCVVPEKRREITTEGGLDVLGEMEKLKKFVPALQKAGILVSLFIDPDPNQISAAKQAGADFVELHTGCYANASGPNVGKELERLRCAAQQGRELGLRINAGHGLNYTNVQKVAGIDGIEELNIGHSLIARAVFVGLPQAVAEMKALCYRNDAGSFR